jgi:hypothetical protein
MPTPSQHGQCRQHSGRDDPSRVPVRPVPLRGRAGQHRGHAEAAGYQRVIPHGEKAGRVRLFPQERMFCVPMSWRRP